MSVAVAETVGADRRITFLIPDQSGHREEEFDPKAAAAKFGEFRTDGKAMFDVTNPAEHTLVVDAGEHGEKLPERMAVIPAYQGG